jgi:hypothetical protein
MTKFKSDELNDDDVLGLEKRGKKDAKFILLRLFFI